MALQTSTAASPAAELVALRHQPGYPVNAGLMDFERDDADFTRQLGFGGKEARGGAKPRQQRQLSQSSRRGAKTAFASA